MGRKFIDCRAFPSEMNCTMEAAVHHAVTVHKHQDTPELRQMTALLLLSHRDARLEGLSQGSVLPQRTAFCHVQKIEQRCAYGRSASGSGKSRRCNDPRQLIPE
jgi:hypothetical protein